MGGVGEHSAVSGSAAQAAPHPKIVQPMEIPKLRKPTEGHLAMVERDYIDKGLISEVDESRQATEQGDGVGNLPDKDGSGPPSTAMSWADQGSRPDSKVSGSRPGT